MTENITRASKQNKLTKTKGDKDYLNQEWCNWRPVASSNAARGLISEKCKLLIESVIWPPDGGKNADVQP